MWSQTMTHAELPPSQCKWSSCYKRQRAPSCDTFIRARSRSNACAAVLDPAGGKCVCVFAHLSNFWMRRADGHHTQLPPQAEGSYTGTRVPSCGVYHSVSEDPHSGNCVKLQWRETKGTVSISAHLNFCFKHSITLFICMIIKIINKEE